MKKWLAYIAYVLIIMAAFLYILFPSAEIKNYIIQRAGQISPSVSIAIGNVKPCFPPGLRFSNLEISTRRQSVFSASKINVIPKYLSLFSRNKTFGIKGIVYEGKLEGEASIENTSKSEYATEISFAGVQVHAIQALKELMPHEVYGTADGRIRYVTKNGFWGNGEAEITINDCRVVLKPPIFGFNDLAPGEVNAVLELQDRRMSVKKITVDGKQLTGNASGTVGLQRSISSSTVKLNGMVKPHPSLIKELGRSVPSKLFSKRDYVDKGIPFSISGTIERPNFSLR